MKTYFLADMSVKTELVKLNPKLYLGVVPIYSLTAIQGLQEGGVNPVYTRIWNKTHSVKGYR